MTRYTHTMCMAFGADGEPDRVEVDATFDYEIDWGRPATAEHYHLPAQASIDASVTGIRLLEIDGRRVKVADAGLHNLIMDALEEGRFDEHLIERAVRIERLDAKNAVNSSDVDGCA